MLVVGAAVTDLAFAVESAMDRCEPMVMERHGNMLCDWGSLTSDMTIVLNRATMRGPVVRDHPCLVHAKHMGPPHDPTVLAQFEFAMTFTCNGIVDSFEAFRVRRTHTRMYYSLTMPVFVGMAGSKNIRCIR